MASKERQRWLPLESNPESFNTWSHSASTRPLQDCYGLDAEVLGWVKQPVKVEWRLPSIYSRDPLVPITEAYEKARLEEDARIEEDGVEYVADIVYFKQTIANACGTFGLLHALANAGVPLEPGYLTKLCEQCKDKTPLERAQLLTATDELERVHTETASSGQTAASPSSNLILVYNIILLFLPTTNLPPQTPDLDTQVDLHFRTFVEHKGNLIELDGRRNSPINRGKITMNLLQDTAVTVKEIIELSNSLEFSLILLITLNPTPED
ncbi:BZ3500_MvSof-1268-A1-R1_Chr8-1g09752 [Microbotryum saponariae]|uniref:Ubiquitin carboxyl-terminal hydrolase n=1 Tax=Microbotryum saponariae TaxID=289078 RepID=A0A2X0LRD8_9BASI|nr:BZ3500_MvSof-1268-A1-R1_Chr8-1g09752 [Microbotryum saponariae]SDA08038.1 BZ3501_MvSof-1269-A2-R1_Chr8-1g09475 [Microbotryum saponariae]